MPAKSSYVKPARRRAHDDEIRTPKAADSTGRTLDGVTRAVMGDRLGFDFANVSIHADGAAAEIAHTLSANAVTIGSDIFFGAGKYAPPTADGQRLLAHELTHVVQNERAPAHIDLSPLGDRSSSPETEARAAADSVAAGRSVSPSAIPTAAVALDGEEGEHHHKAGLLDHIFGLNPDKSFIETGMEGLGYGQDGIWGRSPKEGEGDGTTLLRGLGAAATSPLAGIAAIGGHALDELNHGPLFMHGAFDW
ncbi:MAG: DUF4157 domain-containing protein [Gemmatimonadaceae bacterium]